MKKFLHSVLCMLGIHDEESFSDNEITFLVFYECKRCGKITRVKYEE